MGIPDTYDWDTVFAVDIDVVNRAIRDLAQSPQYTKTIPTGTGDATLTWSFYKWKITDTPGGAILEMNLDFTDGSNLVWASKTTSLKGWYCTIQFFAHFDVKDGLGRLLPNPTRWIQSITLSNQSSEADVVLQIVTQWFMPPDPPKPTDPPPPPPSEALALFEQEFLTVNIGEDVGNNGLPWIKPLVLGFAGNVMSNGVTKALGILAMTGDPDVQPSERYADAVARARNARLDLSNYAIPDGATAGFVLSSRLFFRNLLMPACAETFHGALGDFEIRDTGELVNKKRLDFTQELDGSDRDAYIDAERLTFSFYDDKLKMQMDPMVVKTKYPDLWLDVEVNQAYTAQLGDVQGKKTFLMSAFELKKPKTTVDPGAGAVVSTAVLDALIVATTVALTIKTPRGFLAKAQGLGLDARSAKLWSKIAVAAAGGLGFVAASLWAWFMLDLQIQPHDIPDFALTLNAGLGKIQWPDKSTTKFIPTDVTYAHGLQVTIAIG